MQISNVSTHQKNNNLRLKRGTHTSVYGLVTQQCVDPFKCLNQKTTKINNKQISFHINLHDFININFKKY